MADAGFDDGGGSLAVVLRQYLNGPHEVGRSREYWTILLGVTVLLYLYPTVAADYAVVNTAFLLLWAFLGLGVCVSWGYTGIFSFAQAAFFGIGGYVYGLISINSLPETGHTNWAVAGGIVVAAALSALIGYILFFGGVSDAYVAIFTLMFTVLLEVFLTQTGGPRYTFGKASLGGYNGMIDIPPITLGVGGTRLVFVGEAFYYLTLTLLVVVYLLLRMLVNSAWGYTMIAVREDPNRTEMLGYDIRKVQLTAFTLAGGLAGLSGVLYAAWNNIMTPTTVNATAATMPIIWVATAGRKSLMATIVTTFGLQWLTQYLALTGEQYALLLLGALILGVVLFLPTGIAQSLVTLSARRSLRR